MFVVTYTVMGVEYTKTVETIGAVNRILMEMNSRWFNDRVAARTASVTITQK